MLRLTVLPRNRTLKTLLRGAKFRLDLCACDRCFEKRPHLDAEDFAGWLLLLDICRYRSRMARGFP